MEGNQANTGARQSNPQDAGQNEQSAKLATPEEHSPQGLPNIGQENPQMQQIPQEPMAQQMPQAPISPAINPAMIQAAIIPLMQIPMQGQFPQAAQMQNQMPQPQAGMMPNQAPMPMQGQMQMDPNMVQNPMGMPAAAPMPQDPMMMQNQMPVVNNMNAGFTDPNMGIPMDQMQAPMDPNMADPNVMTPPAEKKSVWPKILVSSLVLVLLAGGGYFGYTTFMTNDTEETSTHAAAEETSTDSAENVNETSEAETEAAAEDGIEDEVEIELEIEKDLMEDREFGLDSFTPEVTTKPISSTDEKETEVKYQEASSNISLTMQVAQPMEGNELESIEMCINEEDPRCVPVKRISNDDTENDIEILENELYKSIIGLELTSGSKAFLRVAAKDQNEEAVYSELFQFTFSGKVKQTVPVKRRNLKEEPTESEELIEDAEITEKTISEEVEEEITQENPESPPEDLTASNDSEDSENSEEVKKKV